jgi:hypothetical protein
VKVNERWDSREMKSSSKTVVIANKSGSTGGCFLVSKVCNS